MTGNKFTPITDELTLHLKITVSQKDENLELYFLK